MTAKKKSAEPLTPKQALAEAKRRMAVDDMQYLATIPRTAPAGRVVVHNHVRPTLKLGSRGFRAWTQVLNPTVEACRSGWAPSLVKHYRVKRQGAA